MNKRILAVALATLMILSILPALATAATQDNRAPPPTKRAAPDDANCALYQSEATTVIDGHIINAKAPLPPFCVFLHPGVADEYKTGWSHTLDTLWGLQSGQVVPGQPGTNAQTRQVFDKYLDYAIMASSSDSIGDLQFDIQIMATVDQITIYVPPEFKWLAPTKYESVWTDITNDNNYISIGTRNEYDSIAPHWTRIVFGTFDIQPGVYHVRFFNLRAPELVGLYHFKIYYSLPGSSASVSIGAGNFPIIIVKGELNPAWVEVTIRAHDQEGVDALVSGVVNATGTTPTGRKVTGMGYWGPVEFVGDNPTPPGPIGGLYRVYLFGLPAGTYTITAQASGFEPGTSERFTLDAGQSYRLIIVIVQSPILSATIWSKHGTGAVPWHNLWQLPYGTNCPSCAPVDAKPRRDVLFDLYDAKGNLLSFWGTDDQNTNTYPAKQQSNQRAIPLNNLLNYPGGGLQPTATNSHFELVDNFDLLAHPRGLTSTNWDGHVPWDIPDYINGIVQGQYTLEAFVTGYIMDEADAYQRSLTVTSMGPGIHYQLQMDLRRTNWIETVIHLPGNYLAGPEVDVTLVATDAGGNERGAAAFELKNWVGMGIGLMEALDGVIDGCDVTGGTTVPSGPGGMTTQCAGGLYMGGIILEGWNALFPNYNAYGVQDLTRPMTGTVTDKMKDYGLNPTASAHSDQAVQQRVKLAGNPYTISLYMTDMGDPSGFAINPDFGLPYNNGNPIPGTGWYNIVGGDPQVSVFLCNSPVSLSFSVVNASAWISLRSVDFEVPAHSRPWTFPGAEIWVDFKDAKTDEVIDSLDPTIYGLFQDPGVTEWRRVFNVPDAVWDERFGFPIVGARTDCKIDTTPVNNYGYTPFDVDRLNCPGQHEHLGVWYYGTDNSAISNGEISIYRTLLPGGRSTRLPAGEYTFEAHTYGYVMRRAFPMFIPTYGAADIEADLIQGGQIRAEIEFFDENVKTAYNGWIVVEIFDAKKNMVGASMYGQAQPNCFTRATNGVDGCPGTYHYYEPEEDWQIVAGPSQATGLDSWGYRYDNWPNTGDYGSVYAPSWAFPSNSFAQRAYNSWTIYPGAPEETWADWDYMTPSEANRVEIPAYSRAEVDVFGFYSYVSGPMRTWAGGWPTANKTSQAAYTGHGYDYGLSGTVDIPGWAGSGGGLYTVKVWAFDPFGPNNKFEGPAPGATDDWRMYSQAVEISNVQVPWGGVQEVYVRMDNMAKLEGVVRWFDMYGDLRPLPWAQISATNPAPTSPAQGYPAYSTGLGAVGAGATDSAGTYVMWLPTGSHDVSVSTSNAAQVWSSAAPTFNSQYTVVVQPGWVGGGDSSLSGSGTPVPEVPAYLLPLTLMAALAASVWLLRKNNVSTSNIPVLMK